MERQWLSVCKYLLGWTQNEVYVMAWWSWLLWWFRFSLFCFGFFFFDIFWEMFKLVTIVTVPTCCQQWMKDLLFQLFGSISYILFLFFVRLFLMIVTLSWIRRNFDLVWWIQTIKDVEHFLKIFNQLSGFLLRTLSQFLGFCFCVFWVLTFC